jgi:hypothetical protein
MPLLPPEPLLAMVLEPPELDPPAELDPPMEPALLDEDLLEVPLLPAELLCFVSEPCPLAPPWAPLLPAPEDADEDELETAFLSSDSEQDATSANANTSLGITRVRVCMSDLQAPGFAKDVPQGCRPAIEAVLRWERQIRGDFPGRTDRYRMFMDLIRMSWFGRRPSAT